MVYVLVVNHDNSSIILSEGHVSDKVEFIVANGFPESSLAVKYFGLPLISTKNHCHQLLDKLTNRMEGPGDSVYITIEISNNNNNNNNNNNLLASFLVEKLQFEIKGIQKLDTQWFKQQQPQSPVIIMPKQRRGEHWFLDASTPSIVSNQILSSADTKTYVVHAVLPSVLPPSYKGATIRYLYYAKATLSGRWLLLENGHFPGEPTKDLIQVEDRIPLQLWVTQKGNGLSSEPGQTDGIVPAITIQMDMYWKELEGDSEWARLNDTYDGFEEGYDSSKDEISSVSSYNPSRENIHKVFGSSLSLQSARSSTNIAAYLEGEHLSRSSNVAPPQLAVAEVLYDSGADVFSPGKSAPIASPRQKFAKSLVGDDIPGLSSSPRAEQPASSEGFTRGRSYNIRMDDQVLLRFTPKNSDSVYYFGDMIGGTLTFFHEERARRCLEVSITLETSETINRRFVHPSRRNSPTITKVQSDHHEVVADMVQTSFLFSIPTDGPMSFSTPCVSVQWVLRFEFFTTPRNVDWKRYEHPLLIEGRDKSEWILPITVHAPPPVNSAVYARNDKPFSLEASWAQIAVEAFKKKNADNKDENAAREFADVFYVHAETDRYSGSIENGQWGAFLHVDFVLGSQGAVVIKAEAYNEIGRDHHYDTSSIWDVIKNKADHTAAILTEDEPSHDHATPQ
ncbi:hypothetical protein ACFE04_003217 [Oxalis oulophora]